MDGDQLGGSFEKKKHYKESRRKGTSFLKESE
jgi:hypothetical protein